MNFVWDLPFAGHAKNGFVRTLLGGWGVSGILSFQTGQPFSIFDFRNTDTLVDKTDSPRPRFAGSVASGNLIPDAQLPNTFLFLPLNPVRDANGNCASAGPFYCSASGNEPLDGTISRNTFRRPGTQYHNLALAKNFALPKIFGREGAKLQLRAEFYNVFNHANLYVDAGTNDVGFDSFVFSDGRSIPAVTVRRGNGSFPSTFGLPSFNDNRQIVIAAKIIF